MKTREKAFTGFLATLLTFVIVYFGVQLFTSDLVLSGTPGWHTTIYPSEIILTRLTFTILVLTLIVYLIYSQTRKILNLLWTRFKNKYAD
ncbi:MAG: hypothetical protein JWN56_62 [Sphingobacteriales bacterium]|nr:hypothetical protein [Sphingobacteriales bacterium]